jgi:spore coat protein CotF
MEVHEVLVNSINLINHFQLLKPHVEDQQLLSIIDRQHKFMAQEYNNLINTLKQKGMNEAVPVYNADHSSASYGLNNPQNQSPNTSVNQMNDRDISSAILSCHKSSALSRMMSSLECADSDLRKILQQGANNCSEQAYEMWQYMNQKGYYQVPTMKDITTDTMINTYTAYQSGQQSGKEYQ